MGSAAIQGQLWGAEARTWAEFQEPVSQPLWEVMLDAARVEAGTRILDVGCGGGGASVLAAARGAQVSGLDASESLIHIARERVPSGDFRVGDLESLPFADASFDVVFASNSVQYAEDKVTALREFKRVCAPNGRCVIGIWSTADKVELRVFLKALRDSLPTPPPGEGPFGLSDPGKLENLLTQAGWTVGDSGEVRCPFVYRDFDEFWKGNTSAGPVQAALRVVSEDVLKANAQRAVEPFVRADGSIMLDNWYRYVTAGT